MAWTDAIRESIRHRTLAVLFGDRAPLLEALATADAAALALALDEVGWQRLGGPQGSGNADFADVDRVEMVKRSRLYYYRDPLARQAIRLYTTYALGQGIEVRHKDPRAQAALDRFKADPGNKREIGPVGLHTQSDRLLVDGEAFLALIHRTPTRPQVRRFDPLEITELVTNPDDYADVWYVRRTTSATSGQPARQRYYASATALWGGGTEADALAALAQVDSAKAQAIAAHRVPDVQVLHVAINTIGTRGYPHLTAMLDWAKAVRAFMEDRATITKAAAQFAFKKKVKGGPPAVNALAQAQRTGSSAAGQGATPGYDRRGAPAGSTHVSNEGIDFEQFRFDTGAGNAKEDLRMLKLHAEMAVGMAEHYFGDSANGNLATATAMERPVELALAAYQLILKEALTALYTLVLELQHLPVDGLEVITPPILNVDKAALLAALTELGHTFPAMNQEFLWREILGALGVKDVDAAVRVIGAYPTPPAVPPSGAFLEALAQIAVDLPELNNEYLWRQILTTAGVQDVEKAVQAMIQAKQQTGATAPSAAPPGSIPALSAGLAADAATRGNPL